MTTHETLAGLAVAAFAVAGFALGAGYFASLRRGVRLAVTRRAWSGYMLLAPVRVVAAALLLSLAARWGVSALLAASAGFLAARQLALRGARRIA